MRDKSFVLFVGSRLASGLIAFSNKKLDKKIWEGAVIAQSSNALLDMAGREVLTHRVTHAARVEALADGRLPARFIRISAQR
jgi:hypothetical protein